MLIDTPGYAPSEWSRAEALARDLSAVEGLEIHLVLSAEASLETLREALERWRAFHPARLAFTRLDARFAPGVVFSTRLVSGLPLSVVSAGPRVPEDIAEADPERLTALLLDEE